MTDISEETRLAARRPVAARLAAVRVAWPAFTAELAADRPIYLLAAIYVVVASILAALLPARPSIDYLLYAPIWLRVGTAALLIYLLARTLPRSSASAPSTRSGGSSPGPPPTSRRARLPASC